MGASQRPVARRIYCADERRAAGRAWPCGAGRVRTGTVCGCIRYAAQPAAPAERPLAAPQQPQPPACWGLLAAAAARVTRHANAARDGWCRRCRDGDGGAQTGTRGRLGGLRRHGLRRLLSMSARRGHGHGGAGLVSLDGHILGKHARPDEGARRWGRIRGWSFILAHAGPDGIRGWSFTLPLRRRRVANAGCAGALRQRHGQDAIACGPRPAGAALSCDLRCSVGHGPGAAPLGSTCSEAVLGPHPGPSRYFHLLCNG